MIRTTLASILIASSFAAHAEGPIESFASTGPSTLTRAEVIAELHRAIAAGEIAHGERSYEARPSGRALSRAEVRAELRLARAQGWVNAGEATSAPEFERRPTASVHIAENQAGHRVK